MTVLCSALWLSNWIWESHFVLGSQVFIQKHGTLNHGWFTVPAEGSRSGTTAARHMLLWDRIDPRLNLTPNRPRSLALPPAPTVFVDYLIVTILFGAWPALQTGVEAVYRRRRERRGLCRRCGFDLRPKRRRCPECGLSTWQRDKPVIDRGWWLSASMRTGAVGLVALLPVSLLGGWLAWGYSVERAQLRKLAAVASQIKTAPVGPAPIATLARKLDLRVFERVTSLTIDPGGTDAGLVHVRNLNELLTLDLSGTNVTDVGMASLASLAKLQRVDLTGTNIKYAHRLRRGRSNLIVDGLPSPPAEALAHVPALPTAVPLRISPRARRRTTRPVPVPGRPVANDRSAASGSAPRPLITATFAETSDAGFG